jgi:radical SAM superfamily enzyme YgiQ (UPF0313 family)
MLKTAGHGVRLLNINEQLDFPLDHNLIRSEIEKFKPGLIAFSVVSNQYQFAEEIAKNIRTYCNAPTLCGGIHATMDPEGVLKSGLFDYVCVGEGEDAVTELAGKLENGGDTDNIANIWTCKNGLIIKNPVRPLKNVTELPAKDYEIFDIQKMIDAKDGWVGLLTSRGCPFRCTYCLNHKIVEIYRTDLKQRNINYIRHHSVDEIISEIDYILSTYKRVKMFIFDDDLFTFNKVYVEEFCEKYSKKYSVPFVCNAHVKVFDDQIAVALKKANCQIVKFGLESGNERVRSQIMHRYMTNANIIDAFVAAERAGLHSSAFVMMGLPSETIEELYDTINLLGAIKPGRFRWAIFFPFINTEAYHITRNMGLIDEDKMKSLTNFTEESCLNVSPQLHKLIKRLSVAFAWYVNAASDLPVAPMYKNLVAEIDKMSENEWDSYKKDIRRIDSDLSKVLRLDGKLHYSIRYNSFTGVRSDWDD